MVRVGRRDPGANYSKNPHPLTPRRTGAADLIHELRGVRMRGGNTDMELFVAPRHYGFVFFGWMALGAMGLFSQIFGRMSALLKPSGFK